MTVTFGYTASATNAGCSLDLFETKSRSILSGLFIPAKNRGSEREVKDVRHGMPANLIMRRSQ